MVSQLATRYLEFWIGLIKKVFSCPETQGSAEAFQETKFDHHHEWNLWLFYVLNWLTRSPSWNLFYLRSIFFLLFKRLCNWPVHVRLYNFMSKFYSRQSLSSGYRCAKNQTRFVYFDWSMTSSMRIESCPTISIVQIAKKSFWPKVDFSRTVKRKYLTEDKGTSDENQRVLLVKTLIYKSVDSKKSIRIILYLRKESQSSKMSKGKVFEVSCLSIMASTSTVEHNN